MVGATNSEWSVILVCRKCEQEAQDLTGDPFDDIAYRCDTCGLVVLEKCESGLDADKMMEALEAETLERFRRALGDALAAGLLRAKGRRVYKPISPPFYPFELRLLHHAKWP